MFYSFFKLDDYKVIRRISNDAYTAAQIITKLISNFLEQ